MDVLSVTSEVYPFAKTGGLADVTGALPKALVAYQIDTVTLVPGYPAILSKVRSGQPLMRFHALLGESATIWRHEEDGITLLVLDVPALYERDGGLYVDGSGRDYSDNWKRFAVLSLAAARIAEGAIPGWKPDVVHTHDWQSALTSVYMRNIGCCTPVLLTIHNLAFQGQFSVDLLPYLHLPPSYFSVHMLEYYGDISFLKGGIQTANVVTTVSPTYAREILTPRFGMGMQGVLRARSDCLKGILNGIDDDEWDPSNDPYLHAPYDASKLSARLQNKKSVMASFGLVENGAPLFASVSRLTWQKGTDLLADAIDDVVASGAKIIVCGQGDRDLENALSEMAANYPNQMAVHIGYSESMAHAIIGGADILIQPSRFEPCGLTQLYALRYGAVPIVSRTGGLLETIIDANDAAMEAGVATGFQFHPINAHGLKGAIHRVIEKYAERNEWRRLQLQGMRANFSWNRSAGRYARLYRELIAAKDVREAGVSTDPSVRAIGRAPTPEILRDIHVGASLPVPETGGIAATTGAFTLNEAKD